MKQKGDLVADIAKSRDSNRKADLVADSSR